MFINTKRKWYLLWYKKKLFLRFNERIFKIVYQIADSVIWIQFLKYNKFEEVVNS